MMESSGDLEELPVLCKEPDFRRNAIGWDYQELPLIALELAGHGLMWQE
jgi:hypothetical protein